ncbi:hypothetical protein VTN49DRAFT_4705 [Thermomyces lanuginosus]|uniref:uncharacterized protein n=1 Tax=Thermomyces lanuginosus TaxID=5541 RepID=UPI003742D0E3
MPANEQNTDSESRSPSRDGVGDQARSTSPDQKRPSRKKSQPENLENGETQSESEFSTESEQERERAQPQPQREKPRRRYRGHDTDDTEEIPRHNGSLDKSGRRRRRPQQKERQQNGPLRGIDSALQEDAVTGTTNAVQNTAGRAVNGATDTAGRVLQGGALGGRNRERQTKKKEDDDDGKKDQLRLRLDLNLDIEVELKARIHGDLTLGLLN